MRNFGHAWQLMSLNLKAAGMQQKPEAWQRAQTLPHDINVAPDRRSVAVDQLETAAFGLGTYQDGATNVQHDNLG